MLRSSISIHLIAKRQEKALMLVLLKHSIIMSNIVYT